MEYAASFVKVKPHMKLYMRGDLLCMELTRDIKPTSTISDDFKEDLDKIVSIIKGNPEINTVIENCHVVVYIKNFTLGMINDVG